MSDMCNSITNKGSVFFSSACENKSVNKNTKNKILEIINNKNETNKFQSIGNLWYYIIKNENFFYKYSL